MVAANGIYKFAVIGTVHGQQHVHTLHFRSTAHPDALAASESAYQQSLIDDWQTNARTQYRAFFPNTTSPCLQYQVRKVCGSLPLPAGVDEGEAAGSQLGTNAVSGEAMAPWLANVVTIRTGLAGRRFRGRNFLGGLFESEVTGATIVAAKLTNVTAYYTALVASYVTPIEVDTKFKWFVFSRVQANVSGIACQNAGADVTGFQVRDQLASMKSRKAGSGV